MKTEGASEDDKTVIETMQNEITELRAKMMEMETNQSTLLARLTELDTKTPSVGTAETSELAVATEAALVALEETTDNDDAPTGRAFAAIPDPIEQISDGTKAPNIPETRARTVDMPNSVETCANAANASMTNYKAGKVARTRTDQPEVVREVIKNEDVTKTTARQPKEDAPANEAPALSVATPKKTEVGQTLKQIGRKATTKDIEPAVMIIKKQNMKEPKKAPIQVPNNQAAQVQCVQPIWTRKPDVIELREYDEFFESTTKVQYGLMTQTRFNTESKVTFKSLRFIPDSRPSDQSDKYGQEAENIKLYVRRVYITDDFKNMMPSYLSFVKGVDDSDHLPPNVSNIRKNRGRQLEAATEEEDSDDRQGDGVCDDQVQRFNQPINETTNPVNAAHVSIAVGEKTHRFTACLIKKTVEEYSLVEDPIGGKESHRSLRTYVTDYSTERRMQPTHHEESNVFDKAYKGDMFNKFNKAYEENVDNKSATDMTDMMYNTATLRSGYTMTEIEADEMIDEEPTGEHNDQDRAKLFKDMTEVPAPKQKAMEDQKTKEGEIAPLDALYPTMRGFSDDEKPQTHHKMLAMHESTYQEAVKNETYRGTRSCAKTMEGEIAPLDALYPTMRVSSDDEKQQTHHRMSAMHESTYKEDVQYETYQENGSRAKNMMMMALHHPRDRQNQTTSLVLTMMQGASRRHGEGEDQDDPLRHGGGGGHN